MSTSVSRTYAFVRLAVASYVFFDEGDPVLALQIMGSKSWSRSI